MKRGTQHWSCNVPALLTWMDSASASSDLISETGSIADLDLRDVDLELAAVTAPAQVIEVSVLMAMQSAGAKQSAALHPIASMPWSSQPTT